jgi:hypothetical protein
MTRVPEWLSWIHSAQHSPLLSIALFPVGFVLFFFTLHIARGVGYAHGRMAEKLLVRK